MKYHTHALMIFCKGKFRYFYLVKGIEYPNLITEGNTLEEALKNAVCVWTFLCTVYENKGEKIKKPFCKFNIDDILDSINCVGYKIIKENCMSAEILSRDTDEYRIECEEKDK